MKNENASRIDKIREETKRAAEFGVQPPSFIPLGKNFRTEGIAAIPYSHDQSLPAALPVSFNHQGTVSGILTGQKPVLATASPKVLTELIKYHLETLNDANRGQIVPELLKAFSDLAAQVKDPKTIEPLHKQVATAAFGPEYFTRGGEAKAKK